MEFNWLEQNGDNFISTIEKKHTLKSVFGRGKLKQAPMDKEAATPIDLKVHCLIDDKQRTKLKSVVDALIAARKRGENIYYEAVPGMSWQSEFDNQYRFEVPAVRLYSADVTYQSALAAMKRRNEIELGLIRTGESAEAKQLIAQSDDWQIYQLSGRIDVLTLNPALEKQWLKYVEKCATFRDIKAVKSLSEILQCIRLNGNVSQDTVNEIKKITDKTCGFSGTRVLEGIKLCCPYGKKIANELIKLYKLEERQRKENSVEKSL